MVRRGMGELGRRRRGGGGGGERCALARGPALCTPDGTQAQPHPNLLKR
jgi:hypothetical protein